MIVFPLYLYNTINSPITIPDISLEMLSFDFFEISSEKELNNYLWTNSDLENLVNQGRIFLVKSKENVPPLIEDIYPAIEAVKILNYVTYASEINYTDSNSIGASNVQDALNIITNNIKKYEQSFIELSEITIEHDLNRFPEVKLLNEDNIEYEAQVEHIDKNNLIIKLNTVMSGTVYCS